MAESSPKLEKTQWKKEKLLVPSNFSFSHSVFKRPLEQTRKNRACLEKGYVYRVLLIVSSQKKKTDFLTLRQRRKIIIVSDRHNFLS